MQERSEVTRAKLLAAATRHFSRYGYEATGVAEVCEAAGVSKGAFYHHFPHKQAIFLELLESWLAELDRQLETIRAEATGVPAALERMARMAPAMFKTARGQLPLFLEFWTQASRDPVIRRATIAPYRRYCQFFAALIRAGQAEGSLRPVDADLAGQSLVSLAVGVLLQGLLDPRGTNWEQAAKGEVQLFLEGLRQG
jgi:AcrR family transcriptional regulator